MPIPAAPRKADRRHPKPSISPSARRWNACRSERPNVELARRFVLPSRPTTPPKILRRGGRKVSGRTDRARRLGRARRDEALRRVIRRGFRGNRSDKACAGSGANCAATGSPPPPARWHAPMKDMAVRSSVREKPHRTGIPDRGRHHARWGRGTASSACGRPTGGWVGHRHVSPAGMASPMSPSSSMPVPERSSAGESAPRRIGVSCSRSRNSPLKNSMVAFWTGLPRHNESQANASSLDHSNIAPGRCFGPLVRTILAGRRTRGQVRRKN